MLAPKKMDVRPSYRWIYVQPMDGRTSNLWMDIRPTFSSRGRIRRNLPDFRVKPGETRGKTPTGVGNVHTRQVRRSYVNSTHF